ncbi:MAG: mandelate racemase [Firmicutes bacterium]|nr:mandelate racemase [Bacillota bacterium]
MKKVYITEIKAEDRRFALHDGDGMDAINKSVFYAYAVCRIKTDAGIDGVGFSMDLGPGNDLVCKAIEYMSQKLVGQEIGEMMADFGRVSASIYEQFDYRWLGPHKGVVHLAAASIVNACYDLWCKVQGVPLWKALTDCTPEQLVAMCDFRYLEDAITKDEALAILRSAQKGREERSKIIETGYHAYDTSVGWFEYSDEKVADNAKKSMDKGFTYLKMKVGSPDPERDIRRTLMLREVVGPEAHIMVDCNQQWTLKQALDIIPRLMEADLFFVEEPTHPDDILAHQTLKRCLPEMTLALGEHVPNRIIFKNYFQAGAVDICQADVTRVAGISEYIVISLMARKFGIQMIPHAGDMGQIHQHMIIFNNISVGHESKFMEHIPHVREYFKYPINVVDGKFVTPQEPGISADFKD